MKTKLKKLLAEAEADFAVWHQISNDPVGLAKRGIHREHAVKSASYFRGMVDAYTEALTLTNGRYSPISVGLG